jgi:hypothetical protein
MNPETSRSPVVVIHAGARDEYQVASALAEAKLLQVLVTNVFSDRIVRSRYDLKFSAAQVHTCGSATILYLGMRAIPSTKMQRTSDQLLASTARRIEYR